MAASLSLPEARKLVLLSQRIPPSSHSGPAVDAIQAALDHLGYIQIDTILVIERAHHHTLWNRNPRYKPGHLDQLLEEKNVFEYWSHAAAYLPMRDLRFSLPRKQALACGQQEHWFERDEKLMQAVIDRITAEGPLMARDFEHSGNKPGEWQSKPAKKALENLFMQGDLMIPHRDNFHKVYDLTERVLPPGLDTRIPTPEEHARFLITRFLQAHGIAQPAEFTYLLKNIKGPVTHALEEMVLVNEVMPVAVNGQTLYTLPGSLELLSRPLARRKLKILSPFDNLVIQRKRMRELFDFDYLIECYLPATKRQYGYFALPILWDGKLVARMDCKADRKTSVLHIHHLALEPGLRKLDAFVSSLQRELRAFLKFNQCHDVQLHRCTPAKVHSTIESALR